MSNLSLFQSPLDLTVFQSIFSKSLLVTFLTKPIMELVNMSFVTGIFPSILKTSKVIPVFKKGLPLEASNYRSTSLLANIEKIYEKLMYSRLVSFLKAHNQIYSRQFGFRKSHSTVHTLLSKLNHYCIFGAANN